MRRKKKKPNTFVVHWASHLAGSYIQHSLCNVLNKHHPAFISKIINVNNQWDCFKGNTTVRYVWTLTINLCSHFIMLAFTIFFMKQICVWHGRDYRIYHRATDKRTEWGSIYLPREINKRGSRGSGEINIAIDHLRCIFNHCPWQMTLLFSKKVGVSMDQWVCRLNLMAYRVENNGRLIVLVHLSQQSTAPLAWVFVCIECICCRGSFHDGSDSLRIINDLLQLTNNSGYNLCIKPISPLDAFGFVALVGTSFPASEACGRKKKLKLRRIAVSLPLSPSCAKTQIYSSTLFRMWGDQVKRFFSSALDRKLCLALSV